ncbi:hypothetical protein V2J09_023819 [Rumex salicifolius]
MVICLLLNGWKRENERKKSVAVRILSARNNAVLPIVEVRDSLLVRRRGFRSAVSCNSEEGSGPQNSELLAFAI